MTSRYSSVAIAFHWTIALLMIANLALGIGYEAFGDDKVPVLMGLHKSIGLTVLVLSLMRLGWRFGHAVPPLPVAMSGWQVMLARTTHVFFYVAMIVLPLSGWLMSSASPIRYPLEFFGMFTVPYLPVEQSKPAAGFWHGIHEILGLGTIAVVALHVLGALKHHFIDKDDVLVRMLPKA